MVRPESRKVVVWVGAGNTRKHVCFSRPAAKKTGLMRTSSMLNDRFNTLALCSDAREHGKTAQSSRIPSQPDQLLGDLYIKLSARNVVEGKVVV
jgi:hypothetical protein